MRKMVALLFAAFLCAGAASARDVTVQVDPGLLPVPMHNTRCTVDTSRDLIVCYGGNLDDLTKVDYTLECNSVGCVDVTASLKPPNCPAYPVALADHVIGYMPDFGDGTSGVFLGFGRAQFANPNNWVRRGNGCWELWNLPTKPSNRYYSLFACADDRRLCLLYDGSAANQETFELRWNDATQAYEWVCIADISTSTTCPAYPAGTDPSLRYGGALIWYPPEDAFLLYGGDNPSFSFAHNTTRRYDLTTRQWVLVPVATPPPNWCQGAYGYDPRSGCLVIASGHDGGLTNSYHSGAWAYCGKDWEFLGVTTGTYAVRNLPGTVWYKGRLMMFGGREPVVNNDLNEFVQVRWNCGYDAGLASVGTRVFDPMCTQDSALKLDPMVDGTTMSYYRHPEDRLFWSGSVNPAHAFDNDAIVDDELVVNGITQPLGPYVMLPEYETVQPFGVPIEQVEAPITSAGEIPQSVIPVGVSELTFEHFDTAGTIYGNTPLSIVRDCSIHVGRRSTDGKTALSLQSFDPPTGVSYRWFCGASGKLSELRVDGNFSRATTLGTTTSLQGRVIDTRTNPLAGDGYYYLIRGYSQCAGDLFGNSSLVPDPRDSVPACGN